MNPVNIALQTLPESYSGRLPAIGVASDTDADTDTDTDADTDADRSLRMGVHALPVPRL